MKFFAVAGSPVLHSKSPVIFANFFKNSSAEAIYGRVAADSACEVIFIFNSFEFEGMNITSPFKNEIIPYLPELDEAASLMGSVNTIARQENGLKGFNTDHTGVVTAFERRGVNLAGKRCVVVGAGGAAVAAAFGLLRKSAEVTIVNRTYEKAQKAAASLGCRAVKSEYLRDVLREADILVSAITQGNEFIKKDWLKAGLLVLDANYKDPSLLRTAESRGCRAIKGEEWLYYQALESYAMFTRQSSMEAKIFFQDFENRFIFPGDCRWKQIVVDSGGKEPPSRKAKLVSGLRKGVDFGEAGSKKLNISLVGFMGCGKTAVGRMLAEKMGLDFIDSDREIEKNEGMEVKEIFEKKGGAYFRAKEKMMVEKLREIRGAVFSCGGGAVADSENGQVLKEHSLVIFLFSTLETCLKRAEGTKRPLLNRNLYGQAAEELYRTRKEAYFRSADLLVNSERKAEEVSNKIHEEIIQAFEN